MARVSAYLNFARSTEAAFQFYRSVFGGEFTAPIQRFGDLPTQPGQPPLADADKNLILHIELAILGGHVLMGTDPPESMGHSLTQGNAVTLNLEPDTLADCKRLFNALSDGSRVDTPRMEMFWGGYFGVLVDKFGMRWMFNCADKR